MPDSTLAMRHLFKWSGEPLGFIDDAGVMFDDVGRYLGWVDLDGTAWCNDGRYFGQLVEGQYVLRNVMRLPPPSKVCTVVARPPSPLPTPVPARTPRAPVPGFVDAFDSLGEVLRRGSVGPGDGASEDLRHALAKRGKRDAPRGE